MVWRAMVMSAIRQRMSPAICLPGRGRDSAKTRGRVGSEWAIRLPHPLDATPAQPAAAGCPGKQVGGQW